MVVQVQRGVDQRQMRERLREIAQLTFRARVVFLRQQADIVAKPDQPLEQRTSLATPALQDLPTMPSGTSATAMTGTTM